MQLCDFTPKSNNVCAYIYEISLLLIDRLNLFSTILSQNV